MTSAEERLRTRQTTCLPRMRDEGMAVLFRSGDRLEMPGEPKSRGRPALHLGPDRGDDVARCDRVVDVVVIELAVQLLQLGGELVQLGDLCQPVPGGIDLVEI